MNEITFEIQKIICTDFSLEVFDIYINGSIFNISRKDLRINCYEVYEIVLRKEANIMNQGINTKRPQVFTVELDSKRINKLQEACWDYALSLNYNKTPLEKLTSDERSNLLCSMLAFLNKEVPIMAKNPRSWNI
jgi:hypothetical protein